MQWLTRVCAGVLAGLLVVVPAMPVSAQSGETEATEEAGFKDLVRKGTQAFQDGDYELAATVFQRAYDEKPVANLLYNIGRSYEKAGDFEKAIASYEKFVNEPDVDIKSRRDALDRMKTLREVVALRKQGEDVDKEDVEERQSDRGLAESEKGGAAEQPGGEPETEVKRNYTLAFVFLGSGIATAGGGGVFGVLASNAHSDFQDATTLDERRSAAERGETYSVVADSMFIAGAALAGVGVYFLISPPEREVPKASATRVVPQVGPKGAGVSLSVDF